MIKKKDEITITLKLTKEQITAGKWYALCPWCGHKTACSEKLVLACPACGQSAFALPCGTQTE
jgi:Zn finger protein HypA/HybF involved in hydrogenase expression